MSTLLPHPTYGRYLTLDQGTRPVIDRAQVQTEARPDGKYLLRASDDTLAPAMCPWGTNGWWRWRTRAPVTGPAVFLHFTEWTADPR